MPNFLSDNPDVQYYFDGGVDWDTLADITELGFRHADGFTSAADARGFYREVAHSVGEFVGNHVAPHAAEIDRNGVELEDGEVRFPTRLASIFEQIAGLGLHGLNLPRELGGSN